MPILTLARARPADGADEQSHAVLLLGEGMLDTGAGSGACPVAVLDILRHRPPLGFLRCTRLMKPGLFDRYAVSAHTSEPVLVLASNPRRPCRRHPEDQGTGRRCAGP